MKQAFIILAIALTTQACDQTCQSKCIKQNKGKNCLDLCNCESLPPPLEEFIAKGSSYSLPKIRQDEKL